MKLTMNDECLYQQLMKLRESDPDATVAQLLDVLCYLVIERTQNPDGPSVLQQFEPWLSREKKRLSWMDRIGN